MSVSAIDVQKAYLAYFGRPADYAGLNYWMNSDAATMKAGFAASAEYAALYSGMSADQRVEQVYQNLFGRASDPVGKAYWVAEFNAGRETVSSLVTSMQANVLGVDISTIANRITYSILFTAQMDTPAEINGYMGAAAAAAARGAMSAVTYTDASLSAARSTLVADVALVVAGVDPSVTPPPDPGPAPDTTAPTMSSAAVAANGLSIVVTYSEALTGTAEAGDYAVTLSSGTTTVTAATIGSGADANKVTLTVSNAIGSAVTVSNLVYTATAGTTNSIKDAAANSAPTQTLASVTNNSTITASTFTLTTGNDTFTGQGLNDTFNGTWTDGDAASTFGVGDVLNGGGGTDTLNISSASTGVITLTDANWVLGGVNALIENITVNNNAGAGAINFATGANFNTAFAVGGVALTTSAGAGATTIDMATTPFTGAATIVSTASGAGFITITSGSGASTVNATTFAGAETINGTGLTSVTITSNGAGVQTVGNSGFTNNLVTINATQHGAGDQVLTSTSASAVTVTVVNDGTGGNQIITTGAGNDIVNATNIGGTTNTYSTGAGNDTINLLNSGVATSNTITGGAGNDAITLAVNAAPDILVYAGATVATDGLDSITNFTVANDIFRFIDTGTQILGTATLGFASGLGTADGLGGTALAAANVIVVTDTQTQTGAGIQALIATINTGTGTDIGNGVFIISAAAGNATLWYDADAASGDAVAIATLVGINLAALATLTAANFEVV